MKTLVKKINELKKSKISRTVKKRLKEFESFNRKGTKEWFSELCFFLLTANLRASTALKIQEQLVSNGFIYLKPNKFKNCI